MGYTLDDLNNIDTDKLSLIDRTKFCSVAVNQLLEMYADKPHLSRAIKEVYFSPEILKKILMGELNEKTKGNY